MTNSSTSQDNGKNESNKLLHGRSIKKILSPILAALATAILSYYVYDYLGREKVEISNIEVKQLSFRISLSKDIKEKFEKFEGSRDWISKREIDRYKNKNLDQDQIKRFLERITKMLKRLDTKLSELNSDYAEVSNIGRLAINIQNEKLSDLSFKYRIKKYISSKNEKDQNVRKTNEILSKDILDKINDRTEEYSKRRKNHEKLLADLTSEIYAKLTINQDKYQVEVVLFNSGDKQAVVRYKGRADIEGTAINLKRKKASDEGTEETRILVLLMDGTGAKEEFLSEFVIIESKSFNGMTLVVDEYNNRKRDIEFSQREYVAGQKTATLFIYDINDKKFQQKDFHFRNALYEEERESLKAFLENEYKNFIDAGSKQRLTNQSS